MHDVAHYFSMCYHIGMTYIMKITKSLGKDFIQLSVFGVIMFLFIAFFAVLIAWPVQTLTTLVIGIVGFAVISLVTDWK